MKVINSLTDLCRLFGAAKPSLLNKAIYDDTECGASISVCTGQPDDHLWWYHSGDDWAYLDCRPVMASGFTIQTIVEGSEAEVKSNPFMFPVAQELINDWISYMESEARTLWLAANRNQD